MPFADILYRHYILFCLMTVDLIWCSGSRMYRKKKSFHMELELLRSNVFRTVSISVLAPVAVMIFRVSRLSCVMLFCYISSFPQ